MTAVSADFQHIRLVVVRDRLPIAFWPISRCIDFTIALALGLWCL